MKLLHRFGAACPTLLLLHCGIALITAVLTACGGSSSTGQSSPPPQAPAITSANHNSFTQGTAGSFQVTATGAPAPAVSESGSLPAGVTFSAGNLSGTPTVSGTFQVTFAAQNGVMPNASQNFTLTVNPAPPPLTITTTSLPNGTVGNAYTATLNASGGVQPYTWSANGGLPSGLTLSSSGTISGTPAATGALSFTVSVSDSENPIVTVSASLSITVNAQNPCANNATLSGAYAMILAGWADSSFGNVFGGVVGSFYADGIGNITQGLVDMNSWFGPAQDTFTGTYCISPTNFNLGTMTINPVTYPNPRTLAFVLQSDGNGNIIFFDTNADFCSGCGLGGFHGSGALRKQQTTPFSTSEIAGSYAFGFSGADGGAPHLAEAGVITADGSGNIIGGEYDFNFGGTITTGSVVPAGSAYTVASTGRGTATIIGTTSAIGLVFYVVSPSEVLFLQDDAPVVAGRALLQSGSFNNSSLSGNMVIGIEDGQAEAEAGILTADGSGSFTYGMDVYSTDIGWGSAPGTGTYLVASNGRVQLSSIGTSSAAPVAYLVGQNEAFLVGTDADVGFGKMTPQSGSNFSTASLNGNFMGGSEQPAGPVAGDEVDFVSFSAASDSVMGADDQNAEINVAQYSPSSDVGICGAADPCSYSVSSNGRVVVTNGVQQTILYIISPSQFIAVTTGLGNMSNLSNPSTFPFLVDFGQ
jgi:hypothetical protein